MLQTDGFDFHLTLRTAVNILPVSCASLSSSVSSTLLSALDGAYDAAPERSRIKAVVITNPHNPFGQCYPREAIKGLLRWCGQRDLHFIGDEVYGLSEFRRPRNEEGFVSALSVISETAEQRTELNGGSGRSLAKTSGSTSRPFSGDRDAKPTMNGHSLAREEPSGLTSSDMDNSDGGTEESTIDVSRVHIIWSLSKDLGCSGLRIVSTLCCPFIRIAPNEAHAPSILYSHLSDTGDTDLSTQQRALDRTPPSLHAASLLSQHPPRDSPVLVRKAARDHQTDACAPRPSIQDRRGAAAAMAGGFHRTTGRCICLGATAAAASESTRRNRQDGRCRWAHRARNRSVVERRWRRGRLGEAAG